MAVYTLNRGETAAQDKVLGANVADAVNFPQETRFVEVITDGTADVFVTTDGSVPTIDGAHTLKIPATALPFSGATARPTSSRRLELDGTQVQLISTGAVKYSVQHVDSLDT